MNSFIVIVFGHQLSKKKQYTFNMCIQKNRMLNYCKSLFLKYIKGTPDEVILVGYAAAFRRRWQTKLKRKA